MTLRQAARELVRIASDIREVAARVDGVQIERWAAARDLRMTAISIETRAGIAERAGIAVGEPDPADISWIRSAAPGEVMEVMGR